MGYVVGFLHVDKLFEGFILFLAFQIGMDRDYLALDAGGLVSPDFGIDPRDVEDVDMDGVRNQESEPLLKRGLVANPLPAFVIVPGYDFRRTHSELRNPTENVFGRIGSEVRDQLIVDGEIGGQRKAKGGESWWRRFPKPFSRKPFPRTVCPGCGPAVLRNRQLVCRKISRHFRGYLSLLTSLFVEPETVGSFLSTKPLISR